MSSGSAATGWTRDLMRGSTADPADERTDANESSAGRLSRHGNPDSAAGRLCQIGVRPMRRPQWWRRRTERVHTSSICSAADRFNLETRSTGMPISKANTSDLTTDYIDCSEDGTLMDNSSGTVSELFLQVSGGNLNPGTKACMQV